MFNWTWKNLAYRVSLCLSLIGLSGCLIPHRVKLTSNGGVHYKRVAIAYEFEKSQHIAATTRPITLVHGMSREPVRGVWSTTSLVLLYPIPDGDAKLARATLQLERTDPDKQNSNPHRATLELDFPKQQLDLLLFDLAHSGFFERQTRPAADVQLQVEIDRGRTAKQWTREPRLDDFIDRVLQEGSPKETSNIEHSTSNFQVKRRKQ